MISKETAQRIKDASRLEDVISDLRKSGKDLYTTCPVCNHVDVKKKSGLVLDPSKQIAKCFHCGFGTNSAVTYLVKVKKLKYQEALAELAQLHGIDTESDADREKRLMAEGKELGDKRYASATAGAPADKGKPVNGKHSLTFRDRQMEESGLGDDDITAIVKQDDNTTTHCLTFKSGTRDQYGNYMPGRGDDMLIYYYDLDGNPVMYRQEKSNRMRELIRVRWQNPDLHQDKEGSPKKYESPYGSGSHIYIPERIRQKYKVATQFDTLFIQEGEKKSEKATKHGLYSVGIMGIQNIGTKEHNLPQDIQLIIQKCEVKQVLFMLDADWDGLSDKLKNGDQVDQRPRSFFYAVKNYKEYMRTLVNLGISVEIWFGYVKPNEANAKGIDDLLVRCLNGREKELKEDISHAMHQKDGSGKWIQVHKITMLPDDKLADLWLLNDSEAFAAKHREKLSKLQEFKIGKLKWRFDENGKLQMAQPLLPSEQYWEETYHDTRSGEARKELQFDYANCFKFLMNRGYYRVRLKSFQWEFVHIDNRVLYKIDNYDIKDYVTEFTKELKRKDVLNMLYRGGPQYLGYEKLSNLDFTRPVLEKATRDSQCLFFSDKIWKITADGIVELTYAEFKNHVWEEKVIKAKVDKLQALISVQVVDNAFRQQIQNPAYKEIPDGEFLYDINADGQKCHFLKFIENTSDFIWKKRQKLAEKQGTGHKITQEEEISMDEVLHDSRHFINKLTAIGYLLHDYKNDSEMKAIIGMDARLSEVGASNGRTGKSLVGKAIEFVIPQVYIPAKNKRITDDQFLFGEVTEKTKNIFLDDVRANIDFEFFFPLITGKLKVNPKGAQPFTLGQEDTPKLYITTNHAINGEGSSFRDRQAYMAFSDFYNDEHKPIDDFGANFFSEWDHDQWNLFYNFMATCLVLYFRSIRDGWAGRNTGIVIPPMENIEKRQLRQQIGEDFLQWAESTYAVKANDEPADDSKLNLQCLRKELFDNFIDQHPHARQYVTPTQFGKKIRYYCQYKEYHFNPKIANEDGINFFDFINANKGQLFEGEADKTGGKEYFTVANKKWSETY